MLVEAADGVEIGVVVTPKAGFRGVQGIDQWRGRLIVKVSAPPEGGKANKELCETLSEFFQAKVEIVRGHGSRFKTVLVRLDKRTAISRMERLA